MGGCFQIYRTIFLIVVRSLKGIFWKERLPQRTESRVCIFSGPDKLVSAI